MPKPNYIISWICKDMIALSWTLMSPHNVCNEMICDFGALHRYKKFNWKPSTKIRLQIWVLIGQLDRWRTVGSNSLKFTHRPMLVYEYLSNVMCANRTWIIYPMCLCMTQVSSEFLRCIPLILLFDKGALSLETGTSTPKYDG